MKTSEMLTNIEEILRTLKDKSSDKITKEIYTNIISDIVILTALEKSLEA